jgi:cardiolipin synthase
MQGRIWTVPNQITFLRLGFLPLFLILMSYERYRWALLVLVVAGLSDGIDGLLARRLNQRSALGAYLDPIVAVVILLVSGYRPFPPSIYGKSTTATQIVLVFTVVLAAAYPNLKLHTFVHVLIYIVTVLSVVSSFHYSFTTARHPGGSTPEEK